MGEPARTSNRTLWLLGALAAVLVGAGGAGLVLNGLADGQWPWQRGNQPAAMASARSRHLVRLLADGHEEAPFVAVVAFDPSDARSVKSAQALAAVQAAYDGPGGARMVVLPVAGTDTAAATLSLLVWAAEEQDVRGLLLGWPAQGTPPLQIRRQLVAMFGEEKVDAWQQRAEESDEVFAALSMARVAEGMGMRAGDVLLNGQLLPAEQAADGKALAAAWQAGAQRVAVLVKQLGQNKAKVQGAAVRDGGLDGLQRDRYLQWIVNGSRMKEI